MTFIEFVDAVDVMLSAAIGWIMLGSAIASLLLLPAGRAVTRFAQWAWRRILPRARRGRCTPVSRPQSPTCGSRDTETPPAPAERRSAPHWAHTDKEAA